MDRAKQARGWLNGTDFAAIPSSNLASDGALASLPVGQTEAKFFFSSFRDGGGVFVGTQPDRSGRYRLTFTGAATVTGAGITDLTQINANTYEFDCDYVGNKWITFTPTAFPIKVSIVKTTDLAAHAGGAIFRQEYLDHLPSGGCFRFMDWHITNNSPVVDLADYPVEASQMWNRVPLSVIIDLCNAKSVNPWINIPHQASDAFVTAWAEELRDALDPDLLIRVELSNEIWNFLFSQATYFSDLALADWSASGGTAWLSAAGKRFAQIMQIFNSVFAGQAHRICGVLAGQAATTETAILTAPLWQSNEPGNYIAPHTLAKEWSIAPYIGWAGASAGATTEGNNIKAQLDISEAAAVSYLKGLFPASLAYSKGRIDAHVPIASSRGLRLTVYEYNNHFDLVACSASALFSGGNPVAGALDAFIEATYSQEMADAQDDLRAYSRSQNGSLMAFFVDMTRASRFGTWGAKTHLGHDSLIWNALVAWHGANGRWWAQ